MDRGGELRPTAMSKRSRLNGNAFQLRHGRRGYLGASHRHAAVIVWLAGLSSKTTKCYDIYFPRVGGIDKGSNVSFSGVPVGQVTKISLLPNRPEFVWVRIEVDQQTPVLEGTTAEIHSISLAGANEIQLNGAERGRPAITQIGPAGLPGRPRELERSERAA